MLRSALRRALRNALRKIKLLRLLAAGGYKPRLHIDLESSHVSIFFVARIPAQPSVTNQFCGYKFVTGPSAVTKSAVLYFEFPGYKRAVTKKILD